jgi:hypothetical protein
VLDHDHALRDRGLERVEPRLKIIDGEADAYITSTGKVFPQARAVKNQNRTLHLVPIPYDRRLQDLYLPTTLSGEDYPSPLAPDEKIETVATSVLLVTFDWPENSERCRRTAKFVDAFFSKIDEFLKPPRHPKWHESSINIKIPGWKRFKAADEWIVQHAASTAFTSELLNRFLTQNHMGAVSPEERAALFRQSRSGRRRSLRSGEVCQLTVRSAPACDECLKHKSRYSDRRATRVEDIKNHPWDIGYPLRGYPIRPVMSYVPICGKVGRMGRPICPVCPM